MSCQPAVTTICCEKLMVHIASQRSSPQSGRFRAPKKWSRHSFLIAGETYSLLTFWKMRFENGWFSQHKKPDHGQQWPFSGAAWRTWPRWQERPEQIIFSPIALSSRAAFVFPRAKRIPFWLLGKREFWQTLRLRQKRKKKGHKSQEGQGIVAWTKTLRGRRGWTSRLFDM